MTRLARTVALALLGCALALPAVAADHIKLGLVKVANSGGTFIAIEKGYFAAEGIDAQIIFFDGGAVPITVGVVSGDLDFGETATSASLFNFGGKGAVKIIGGETREGKTFHNFALAASNKGWAAGLRNFTDLPGKTLAITSIGSTPQYRLQLIADKFGFDAKTVTLRAVQSVPNVISTLKGNQVDGTINASTQLVPMFDRGEAHLVGWISDEVRFQSAVTFTSTKTADQRQDLVRRYLRALHHGFKDFHDAFTGPGEVRADQPTAPEILAIISKYTGESIAATRLSIAYVPPDGGGLDTHDIARQINWYLSMGMLKPPVDANEMIDRRYVVDLPVK